MHEVALLARGVSPRRLGLMALHDSGLQLAIVTSNVRANVVEALGPSIDLFRPDCIYTKDVMVGSSKSEAIASATTRCQANPSEVIYVGDQPADWEAAKAAGVKFLGVTYGWATSKEDKGFPIANDVPGIFEYISNQNTLNDPKI